MDRTFTMSSLALSVLLTWPAFAEGALSTTDLEQGTVTCGQFGTMDSVSQIEALSAIQPLGDEIDPADADAARQWAADVSGACAGHADRLLADAAREALGE